MIILTPDIFIVIENLITTELHHSQDKLKFINNEEILHLPIIFLSERNVAVVFLDLTLCYRNLLAVTVLCVDFHQDHVHELHLLQENLSMCFNRVSLKFLITTQKILQCQKTNSKVMCTPLKRQMP